jgi:hypothetical protein
MLCSVTDLQAPLATAASWDCQECGACCDHDPSWPRFSLESDMALALIPALLTADSETGMRCRGSRCTALAGVIGVAVACTIHPVRPIVCRDCLPGDDECRIARAAHGLPA